MRLLHGPLPAQASLCYRYALFKPCISRKKCDISQPSTGTTFTKNAKFFHLNAEIFIKVSADLRVVKVLQKRALLIAILTINLIIAGIALAITPDSFEINKEYSYTNISGMAWDGNHIWTSSTKTGLIYKHAMDEKLSVISTYPSPGGMPYGLAWDGSNLWSIDYKAKKIYKHNMDDCLSVAQSFNAHSKYYPVGLAWDGSNIWSTDVDLNSSSYAKIRKHNMDETLSIAEEYTGPFDSAQGRYAELRGITWYENELWATNYLQGFPASVMKFDNLMQPTHYYTVPGYTTVTNYGWTGLAWINNHLWVSNFFYPLYDLIPVGGDTPQDGDPAGDDGSGSDGNDEGTGDENTGGDETADGDGDQTGGDNNEGEPGEEPFNGNTPPGDNVTVSLERGITLSFGKILTGGETSVSFNDTGPYGPSTGFRYRNKYFTISTTAIYEGPICITVNYLDSEINGSDRNLKLFHWGNDTWVDITTFLDRENNILIGTTNKL